MTQEQHALRRSPVLTGILSALVPGLGQLVQGLAYRGVTIFLTFMVILGIVLWYGHPAWAFAPIGIYLWNIWDAVSRPLGRKSYLWIPVLLSLAASYGIGWDVLQIDLSTADVNRAIAIAKPMLHPDFLQPRRELKQIWVNVQLPCSSEPPKAERTDNGITATVTPDCGNLGETLIVTASGLWPDTETKIWWETPIGEPKALGEGESRDLLVTTDENGNLAAAFQIPSTALVAAPDPSQPQLHQLFLEQFRNIGGVELSFIGREVLKGARDTIAMALVATVLSIFLAVPLSFLAARNLMSANPLTLVIYTIVRTILNILRSIESLIVAIIFVVIVGLGPPAGVIALAIHSVAALAKLYSEVIEGIDPGPIEAIRATGATWVQVVRYGVIPQIVPPFTAFTIYRWDINVRSSTIIGFVGGGGIGFLLIELIRINNMRGVSAVFISIAVIVVTLDYISAKIRERLV